jgi:hypothetical protein
MADSPVFDWVGAALERATPFNSLQARGTIRLALKQAGLEAASVDVNGMCAVLQRIMPKELASRKVADGEAICARLVSELKAADPSAPKKDQQSPEDVFRRMFERPDGAPPRR